MARRGGDRGLARRARRTAVAAGTGRLSTAPNGWGGRGGCGAVLMRFPTLYARTRTRAVTFSLSEPQAGSMMMP